MRIVFYIIVKGQKNRRFDKATLLDNFIKSKKLPKAAIIRLVYDEIIVGEYTVENYLKLEHQNENNR